MTLTTHQNPLFDKNDPTADPNNVDAPVALHRRRTRSAKREIRDLRRKQTAETAIEGFDHDVEIYGFTKGQFSVIDLIEAALAYTGPAAMVVSTWTAANTDVTTVLDFVESGQVTDARWLVDLTFQRRSPELAKRIRDVFGMDAIRVAQNHAKFVLLGNDDWRVVIRTSMNLNFNPRFENFEISHDPQLFDFHAAIIDELWSKQSRKMASQTPYEIIKHFQADL